MIELYQGRAVCPRCDGNGLIYKAYIKDLNIYLYVCDECEASWQNSEIDFATFVGLLTFLKKRGSSYDEMVDLGYEWTKDEL